MARIPRVDTTEELYLAHVPYQEIARLLHRKPETIQRRLYALGYKRLRSTSPPAGQALRRRMTREVRIGQERRQWLHAQGYDGSAYYQRLSHLE